MTEKEGAIPYIRIVRGGGSVYWENVFFKNLEVPGILSITNRTNSKLILS